MSAMYEADRDLHGQHVEQTGSKGSWKTQPSNVVKIARGELSQATDGTTQIVYREKRKLTDQDICNFLVTLTRAGKKVFLISSQKEDPTLLKWIKPLKVERVDIKIAGQ